jgi:hypothetical protein
MIDFEQIEQEDRLYPWLADGSMGDHTCEIEGSISDYWYQDEIAEYPDQDEDEVELNVETDYTYNISNAYPWDGWNV